MKGISAVIITFNEADRIEACLEPLSFCDEIVVVDSGSTDGTCDIARRFTDRVIHHDWPGYRTQKKYATSLARGPWILLLDQDEVVTPELARMIEAMPDDPQAGGFFIRRDLYFMGRLMRHGGAYPDWVLKLFRKDKAIFSGSDTHPSVEVKDVVGKLNGALMHHSYRNLEDYFGKFNRYTSLAAHERFDRGKKFSFIQNFRTFYEFIVRYILRLGFLDGYPGFVYALLSSFYAWTKYTKLKELEENKTKFSGS